MIGMQQLQSTAMAVTWKLVTFKEEVTLKIAVIAVNEAKSIKPSKAQKRTLTHTDITGVFVLLQIR
jgi:hypothetical protein